MKKWLLITAVCLVTVKPVLAQQTTEIATAQITEKLQQVGLTVKEIKAAPVAGLAQVFTDKGLFFMSADGRYLISGNVLDLDNWTEVQGNLVPVSVKEQQMKGFIQTSVGELADSAIEFKAKNEKVVISVFTDPTCGYCRKLHEEIADYNRSGITVRYFAYPRAGLDSDTYVQMQHIWCSKNTQQAMNTAKAGKNVAQTMCQNKVKEHYAMGQSFGLTGTPAIILEDGSIIPGYQPAAVLASQLITN